MKGKKFLALAVSAAMCMSLLAGCGGTGTEDVVESSVQEETVESSAETEPETEAESQPEEESGAEVSENPLEKLTQGYYSYVYNTEPDGSGMEMYNFFHFYEEQPVLGSVFYAGFAMNQIFFVGTYTVEEVPYDYSCFPDREAVLANTEDTDTHVSGTAPYTITCYDWDGNEIGKWALTATIFTMTARPFPQSAPRKTYLHLTRTEVKRDMRIITQERLARLTWTL